MSKQLIKQIQAQIKTHSQKMINSMKKDITSTYHAKEKEIEEMYDKRESKIKKIYSSFLQKIDKLQSKQKRDAEKPISLLNKSIRNLKSKKSKGVKFRKNCCKSEKILKKSIKMK